MILIICQHDSLFSIAAFKPTSLQFHNLKFTQRSPMQHAIDPKIDCVFKALLGSEENRNLLIHFLNAFLATELNEPLVWVDIINPYNDKEFLNDKLSIVDVKARDRFEQLYQIEIQLTSYGNLPSRIVYNWADIYSKQLKSGKDYGELKPTYSIWLLAENLLHHDTEYRHHYKLRDEQGQCLTQHGGIWLVELNKFNATTIANEEHRWLKFFKEGEHLNDTTLPDWMTTPEMTQAMTTLSLFSEKERQYDKYQARQEYLREQRTLQKEQEQTSKELKQTHQKLEQASAQLEQANEKLEQTSEKLEQTSEKLEQTSEKLEQTSEKLEQTNQALLAEQLEKLTALQREESALQEKESALQREESALQREESALAEIEHLKALLAKQ